MNPTNSESNILPRESISVLELRKQDSCKYHKVHLEETVPHPFFPLNPDSHWNPVRFAESFVLEILDGVVVGRDGYVINNNNLVVKETTHRWHHYLQHPLFQMKALAQIQFTKKRVAVIASSASNCYYHWMLDVLPRLKLLQECSMDYDLLYVPKMRFPFQKDTLEIIGIKPDKIFEGTDETCLRASQLVVPSLIGGVFATRPNWACQYLRNTFLGYDRKSISKTNRVYISRRTYTTVSRYVGNETEVFDFLKSKGFKRYILEDLSVKEQAQLFSGAEMVVATHGAALTNLVFCEPGTHVIEVFLPHYLDESYFSLGKQMQLNHFCILSEHEKLTTEQKRQGDIYIPVEILAESLEL